MPAIKINAAAQAAFAAFVLSAQSATRSLREAMLAAGFETWEAAEPQAVAFVSTKYGVPVVASKSPFNKGAPVLDRAAPRFAAAKQALVRLREALTGDADAETAEPTGATTATRYEIPEEIAEIAAQLVAACRLYDGMEAKEQRAMAAQAIAAAFKAK